MTLPDEIGTPGPWRGHPNTVTREMLFQVLTYLDGKPATADRVAHILRGCQDQSEPLINSGSARAVDVTLQLLKKWGLIRYRKGAGWEVVA